MEGWIGVDLDGTLAHYDGWKGENHIGAPIPLMAARVRAWRAEGKKVKIMTARAAHGKHGIEPVQDWCERHFGERFEVTDQKDMAMICLYDDRCVQVEPNTGEFTAKNRVGELEVLAQALFGELMQYMGDGIVQSNEPEIVRHVRQVMPSIFGASRTE